MIYRVYDPSQGRLVLQKSAIDRPALTGRILHWPPVGHKSCFLDSLQLDKGPSINVRICHVFPCLDAKHPTSTLSHPAGNLQA